MSPLITLLTSLSDRRHGRTRHLPLDNNTLHSHILLDPKDKDNFSPIPDLESMLFTIIEVSYPSQDRHTYDF